MVKSLVQIGGIKTPRMRRCPKCWTYTFKEKCPVCGSGTLIPHPEPFSIPTSQR